MDSYQKIDADYICIYEEGYEYEKMKTGNGNHYEKDSIEWHLWELGADCAASKFDMSAESIMLYVEAFK